MSKFRRVLPLALLLQAACSDDCNTCVPVPPPEPRLVSILVEVYDPITNLVWENVSVRIVEADQEWSGFTYQSPYEDWYLTDGFGQVYLDEFRLAAAEVGFREDGLGRAFLGPSAYEDEAIVVLQVDALGFTPVIVEVLLRWSSPDVFVEVPFN